MVVSVFLISSVALFGLFSLATAIARDFPSLVFARLITGVGLGGGVAESDRPDV